MEARKTARDFKGRIELMKSTTLEKLESLFLELFELGLKDYLQKEKEKFPEKTHKEIIIDMYKFHDRLRGRIS
jgi:hypothetical protein